MSLYRDEKRRIDEADRLLDAAERRLNDDKVDLTRVEQLVRQARAQLSPMLTPIVPAP